MHYGAKNPNFEYSMNKEGAYPHILKVTSVERDLGVIMINNLKWADPIRFAVAKANRAIGRRSLILAQSAQFYLLIV